MAERQPLSEDHRLLGRLLRSARQQVGATTRDVGIRSSGHISNVEKGMVTPSRELVEHYITHYGCDRRPVLHFFDKVQRWGAEKRRHPARSKERVPYRVTESSPFEEIRQGYQVQESESYYRLDERFVIREVDAIRWISAVYPGVDLVSVRFMYPSDLRPALILKAGYGCSVAKVVETTSGFLGAVLKLSSAISPGDCTPYPFSFKVVNVSQNPARPNIRYYSRAVLSRCAIRLQFHEGALPEKVWWFRDTHSSISAYAPEPGQLIEENETGFYFADFRDVNEEHVGLSWMGSDGRV